MFSVVLNDFFFIYFELNWFDAATMIITIQYASFYFIKLSEKCFRYWKCTGIQCKNFICTLNLMGDYIL